MDFLSQFTATDEAPSLQPSRPEVGHAPSVPAPAANPARWTAETVAVTEEEKKLFHDDRSGAGAFLAMELVEHDRTTPTGIAGDHSQSAAAALVPDEKAASPEADQPEKLSAIPPEPEINPETMQTSLPSESHETTGEKFALEDSARIEHLIRQSIEEMMPQIVDRIVRLVTISLRRNEE